MVPPGKHIYRYVLGDDYKVPFDTTAHFINAHLHPHGQYIELRDATAKKTLFISRAKNFKDRVGIEKLEDYSDEKGMPIYRDHKYELTTLYDNPTDHDIDAMAILFLYLEDKKFDKTQLAK